MPKREPLTLRNDPARQSRDMTSRVMTVRAESVNEEQRSVEAVIATETPAEVYDWRRDEVIEEILRADGAELPEQMPLLASHNRWNLDGVLGSVRNLRSEKSQVIGRLYFAEGDEDAQRAWNKVRQGHITDVSVGYHTIEYTDIPAGSTRTVKRREYTAKNRTLRITTRWGPKEGSLVPIGADPVAKIREEPGTPPRNSNQRKKHMDPLVRRYLESIGLSHDAETEAAQTFLDGLEGGQREMAAEIISRASAGDPPPNPPAPPAQDPPPAQPARQQTVPAGATPDEATIRAEAQTAERERIQNIRQVCEQDMPAEFVDQAIRENWTVDRVRTGVLDQVRGRRPAPVDGAPPAGTPAIHSRNHDTDCTARALGAAMVLREGLDPTEVFGHGLRYDAVRGMYVRTRSDGPSEETVRAAEMGDRYSDFSLVDVCREALRLDGISVPTTRRETIRAAVSGSTLTNIFTTNISAQLLVGWQDAADSTIGWCSEADVPNFQTNPRVAMGKFGALTKHGRGKTADHLSTSDSKEEYKVARYSGQFVVDEMDIIDDRLGAIDQLSPQDMGLSARQLRPNLVYAILHANAALSDSVALFHATHANYATTSTALAAATLQATIVAMAKHRIDGRPLNIKPRFLIIPQDLKFAAEILLKSAERVISSSSGGTYNPLKDANLDLRCDDRMGVAGVTDPASDTVHAGLATNYLLAARPGEEGAKTIEVGYLRGTGRAPQLRSFVLTQGQWGIGWDMNMDIGAKALDYRGLCWRSGAS